MVSYTNHRKTVSTFLGEDQVSKMQKITGRRRTEIQSHKQIEARMLKFYEQVVTEEFVQSVLKATGVAVRDGIFKASILIWLMIFQRLSPDHSLSAAVDELVYGESSRLLNRAKGSIRARARRV